MADFLGALVRKRPCNSCMPAVYSLGHGNKPLEFQSSCALVLTALGDDEWTGTWSLSAFERRKLLRDIEEDDGTSHHIDGKLSLEEILGFIKNDDNRTLVHAMPASVHGILIEDIVIEAFQQFDVNGDRHLDVSEWFDFIDTLAVLHLKYLLGVSFLAFRAFFGRGQSWDGQHWRGKHEEARLLEADDGAAQSHQVARHLSDAAGLLGHMTWTTCRGNDEGWAVLSQLPARAPPRLQVGCDADWGGSLLNPLPPGWWQDLYYYSANNHPLHGIFACDPVHDLNWVERLAMEVSALGLSLFSENQHREWVELGRPPRSFPLLANERVFSVVVVSLPGLLVWWVFFLLFTCPKCGHVDSAKAPRRERSRAGLISCVGAGVGYVLLVFGCVAFAWSCVRARYLRVAVLGRLRAYAIAWFLIVLVYFNPWIAWGQPDPDGPPSLGDLVGLGQWRVEKQRFQARCRKALRLLTKQQHWHERASAPFCTESTFVSAGWRSPWAD